MNVIAINGSPRKAHSTAKLLEKVQEGASSQGAQTKLVHLYDLDYKGCISCFACKRNGGQSIGRCAMRDDLTTLLNELHEADVVAIGTPLYFLAETAMTRAFLERFLFQYSVYSNPPGSKFPRQIHTALIYTMNLPESMFDAFGVEAIVNRIPKVMERIFGYCYTLVVADTLQFDDYSKYENTLFDPAAKLQRYNELFPRDMQCAFELGQRLVQS